MPRGWQALEVIPADGGAGLYLHRHDIRPRLDQEIDFVALGIPPIIELGGFDLPFRDLGMPRLQQEDDLAGLEQGKPAAGGGMRNSDVVPQALHVQQLSHAAGTEAHEFLKQRQVLDGDQLADILLHIGFPVIAEGLGCIDAGIVDTRVP